VSVPDWQPIDLGPYLDGSIVELPATMLARTDGVKMFAPGKIYWLSGPPESNKSWAAQILTAETVMGGHHVIYIDFETDPLPIVNRLLALGCSEESLSQGLHYFRPETPMKNTDSIIACAVKFKPTVTVIDGVAAAMGTSGFDGNKAGDVYAWWALLGAKLKPLTDGPICAVDHVVKSAESRGVYASGSGQKLALVDCHFGFETKEPVGRGLIGYAIISVLKDKTGWLWRHAGKYSPEHGAPFAKLSIKADHDGEVVRYKIDPTQVSDGVFRPSTLMERVSKTMAQTGGAMSKNAITEVVPGKAVYIRMAIDILTTEGYLQATPKGKFFVYSHLKAFEMEGEPGEQLPLYDAGWRSASQCVPGASGTRGGQSASLRPTLHRGDADALPPPALDADQNNEVRPGLTNEDADIEALDHVITGDDAKEVEDTRQLDERPRDLDIEAVLEAHYDAEEEEVSL